MGSTETNKLTVVSRDESLKVTDLIDKAALQALQDQFTDAHGIANGLLDVNASPITFERGHCDYCIAIREKTRNGYRLCRESDRILITAIKKYKRPFWHICEGLLLDFGAPVLTDGRVGAFFLWGQIRCNHCNTRRTAIPNIFKHLGIRKAVDGTKRVVPSAVRDEYSQLENKSDQDIQTIAATGLAFAERLNGILRKLVHWVRPQEIKEFIVQMVRTRDMDELLDLCVSQIPKLLETRECSIFTVVRERANVKPRLVLQRTSYGPSRQREGRTSYLEGDGLTGWVWQNRCALRINNIYDKRELAQYPGLRWSRTVDDSGTHKEWLGAPLVGVNGEVIGVVRVPEKKRNGRDLGGGFDFRDEIRLMLVAQHIAHEIELLRARERTSSALRTCLDCALRLSRAEDGIVIMQTVLDASENMFGSEGKAHFFNTTHSRQNELRTQDVRGTLTNSSMRQCALPKGSLSSYCMSRRHPVIIHDIPEAKRKGIYFELASDLECAMSAPICSGSRFFGTLSVGANRRYAFTEELDLHILVDIASMAGAALLRLEAEDMAQSTLQIRGVTHTLSNRIPTLKNWISLLRKRLGAHSPQEVERLLVRAIEAAKQYGRLAGPMEVRSFDLGTHLRRLQGLYADSRIHWTIRGRIPMFGEQRLIEQTIVELLDNALRFIDKKTGTVNVTAYRRQGSVIVRIDDNGPGVPADRKNSIFSTSVTCDPSSHFGYGLSFVQRVVQRHGGYVKETGNEGAGASFRMVFPFKWEADRDG